VRKRTHTPSPPKLPGFLMGIGLGGFIDGILLHQILQWDHMLTGGSGVGPHEGVTIDWTDDRWQRGLGPP
jgi:uncharacterized membrane protein